MRGRSHRRKNVGEFNRIPRGRSGPRRRHGPGRRGDRQFGALARGVPTRGGLGRRRRWRGGPPASGRAAAAGALPWATRRAGLPSPARRAGVATARRSSPPPAPAGPARQTRAADAVAGVTAPGRRTLWRRRVGRRGCGTRSGGKRHLAASAANRPVMRCSRDQSRIIRRPAASLLRPLDPHPRRRGPAEALDDLGQAVGEGGGSGGDGRHEQNKNISGRRGQAKICAV